MSEAKQRELEAEIKRLKARVKELEGYDRARLFKTFTSGKQYLLRMDEALYEYRTSLATEQQLNSILNDFFSAFVAFFKMEKILDFGEETVFDPEKHRHDVKDKILPGTPIVIILPGWRLKGSDMEVKPLVRSKA